jgi:hypothetical protein
MIPALAMKRCTRGEDYGNSDKKGSVSQRIAFIGVGVLRATSIKGS